MPRRAGRPPKSNPKRRYGGRMSFTIYLPEREAQVIRRTAETLGLPFGELLRMLVVDAVRYRLKVVAHPPRPKRTPRGPRR